MSEKIFCQKLQVEAEALSYAPCPGELGQRLLESISQAAWDDWLSHQTMLINEYRLNLSSSDSREFLREEMDKFLFGSGSDTPSGYTPKD